MFSQVILFCTQHMLTSALLLSYVELETKWMEIFAAYEHDELQKSMELHFIISLEHFKRLHLCVNMYLCIT